MEAYLVAKSEEKEQSAARIAAEIDRCSGNFSAAFSFDVDQFMIDLVTVADPQDIVVIPEEIRAECRGATIGQLEEDNLNIAAPTTEAPYTIMERHPFSIEELYKKMAGAWLGERINAFPILGFELSHHNYPVQYPYTDKIISAVLSKAPGGNIIAVDPDASTVNYCRSNSISYYKNDSLPGRPMESVPNCIRFRGFTSYRALAETGVRQCGFVFNPHRKTSQALLTSITRIPHGYDFVYSSRGRTYRGHYPYIVPSYLHTYKIDVWPRLFGLKMRDVHPKWYPYDFVTTETYVISMGRITMIDIDLISPQFFKKTHQKERKFQYELTEEQARTEPHIVIRSRGHTQLIERTYVKGVMIVANVVSKSPGSITLEYAHCGKTSTHRMELMGKLPRNPNFYYYDHKYYYFLQGDVHGAVLMSCVNVAVYKGFSNAFGAMVYDIVIHDVITASNYLHKEGVFPIVRDYLTDEFPELEDSTIGLSDLVDHTYTIEDEFSKIVL